MSLAEQLAVLVFAGDVAGIAGLFAWLWYLRPTAATARSKARRDEENAHAAEVQAWKDLPDRNLDGSDVDTQVLREVPVVRREPLNAWRPARRGETPGTVEPDDAPAPVWTARSSEGRHHYSGDVHADRHWHQARHAAIGERDPRIEAILTPTQALFVDALVMAGETPPTSFGPAELMHRRIQWDDEPEIWRQTELEV